MGDGHTRITPVVPKKGDRTHACMVLSGQTHLQAKIVFATLPEDLKDKFNPPYIEILRTFLLSFGSLTSSVPFALY